LLASCAMETTTTQTTLCDYGSQTRIRRSNRMDDQLWPAIDEALITMLDRLIPERSPGMEDTDREIWFKVGQRQVVRMLRAIYDEQQQDIAS
jgi:hypothetical protein